MALAGRLPSLSLEEAIWLLQALGTPDECRDRIQQVKDTAALIEGAIQYDEDRLQAAQEDSEQAQATLDSLGVIYDPETKSVLIPGGKKGGTPTKYMNYRIGNAAEFIEQKYRREGKPRPSSQQLRDAVAQQLSLWFAGELDASPGENIEQAIRNRRTQRQRLIADIENLQPDDEAVEQGIREEAFPFADVWREAPIDYLFKFREIVEARWGDQRR